MKKALSPELQETIQNVQQELNAMGVELVATDKSETVISKNQNCYWNSGYGWVASIKDASKYPSSNLACLAFKPYLSVAKEQFITMVNKSGSYVGLDLSTNPKRLSEQTCSTEKIHYPTPNLNSANGLDRGLHPVT